MNQKTTPTNRFQGNQRQNGNQNQRTAQQQNPRMQQQQQQNPRMQQQQQQNPRMMQQQQQNARGLQQNQFNRPNQGGRGNDRFQDSSQSVRPLVNSAGPLHQQLALQAVANRAPMRPGAGGMGMMRSNMSPGSSARSNFGPMGPPGQIQMSGPNAIPVNGPRGGGNFGGMSGRPNNSRDWDFGY